MENLQETPEAGSDMTRSGGFTKVDPLSLSDRIYMQFRQRLMRGELPPHYRIRTRDTARELGTSETPIREAVFQLVRDGALELKPRHYIRVRRLSLREYVELRDIRLKLEPMAAERALPHFDDELIDELADIHARLIRAEDEASYSDAIELNHRFHFKIYRRSQMPALIDVLESFWMRIGPLLNLQYPHGKPTYDGEHQHLTILRALRARDSTGLAQAVGNDLIEGGRDFLRHLEHLERTGEA